MSLNISPPTKEDLGQITIDEDRSLLDISRERTVLLIFLRHFGCSFCREALSDIAELKEVLIDHKIKVVFMHMEPLEVANKYLEKYDMPDVVSLSDPTRYWYQRFGLESGSLSQIYGFKNMIRGVGKGISLESFGYNVSIDVKQMPGVFVIENGEIISSFYHKAISDRPDYKLLLSIT